MELNKKRRKMLYYSLGYPAITTIGGNVSAKDTVADKKVDISSLKDFGAIGDGLSDDTNALKLALAKSKSVFIPPGKYLISSTISVPSNTEIFGKGSGKSCVFIAKNNFQSDANKVNSIFSFWNTSNSNLRNICINANFSSQACVSIRRDSYSNMFENIFTENTPVEGWHVVIGNASENRFDKLNCSNGQQAILIDCLLDSGNFSGFNTFDKIRLFSQTNIGIFFKNGAIGCNISNFMGDLDTAHFVKNSITGTKDNARGIKISQAIEAKITNSRCNISNGQYENTEAHGYAFESDYFNTFIAVGVTANWIAPFYPSSTIKPIWLSFSSLNTPELQVYSRIRHYCFNDCIMDNGLIKSSFHEAISPIDTIFRSLTFPINHISINSIIEKLFLPIDANGSVNLRHQIISFGMLSKHEIILFDSGIQGSSSYSSTPNIRLSNNDSIYAIRIYVKAHTGSYCRLAPLQLTFTSSG